MDINVNALACVGAGQCALVADQLFDQDDEGIVLLLESRPSPAQESSAQRAATLCPARAIQIRP